MFNVQNVRSVIFHRVHRNGEEIKNDLPNKIESVIENEAWKQVTNPSTGKPFESLGDWLVANYPYGPGVGQGQYAISYEELIVLCEGRPTLCKLLKDNRPKAKRGGDRRSEEFKRDNITVEKPVHGSTSRLYIEQRLKREFPKVWKQYLEGNFTSARQAGISAGFIKDSHDPVMRLKSNWNKATKSQRKEFLKWLESQS